MPERVEPLSAEVARKSDAIVLETETTRHGCYVRDVKAEVVSLFATIDALRAQLAATEARAEQLRAALEEIPCRESPYDRMGKYCGRCSVCRVRTPALASDGSGQTPARLGEYAAAVRGLAEAAEWAWPECVKCHERHHRECQHWGVWNGLMWAGQDCQAPESLACSAGRAALVAIQRAGIEVKDD